MPASAQDLTQVASAATSPRTAWIRRRPQSTPPPFALFTLENKPDKGNQNMPRHHGETIAGRPDRHIDLHCTGKPNRGVPLRAVVCVTVG